MELEERRRIAKIFTCIFLSFFLVGMVLATQSVASTCQYDPLLGSRLKIGTFYLYPPYNYFIWLYKLDKIIPRILNDAQIYLYITGLIGCIVGILTAKAQRKRISHGSADWADSKDIETTKLNVKEGVVLGINPYTNKLLYHDGPEHILLMAPTRSGKGICVIIPTCFLWRHSIFVLDVKSENWETTAGYRKNVLHQCVMKFDPMCADGSSARWNPLAEISYRLTNEFSDIEIIVNMLVNPDGSKEKSNDYWKNAGAAVLRGVILHLLYAHDRENRPLPCLADIATFLTSPEHPLDEQMECMRTYPHISPEEFFSDHNVLEENYGEYIKDFSLFNDALSCAVYCLKDLKSVLKDRDDVDFTKAPFHLLLTHPRVAECAMEILNKANEEQSGVVSTAKTCLNLYQNPVIAKNTAVSDFKMQDLLDPEQAISFYLLIPPNKLESLRPLIRLFITSMLNSLLEELKTTNGKFKQRLLLMLDEFPQFGELSKIETALSVCAGYGVKICVVCQDINQLNKSYTKENSIASNCLVHIYFTPNLDGNTAPMISKMLGKKTILVQSNSDQGGAFKSSTSTSATSRNLMEPDEVSRMSEDKELVFVAGHKPLLGKKLRWFKVPALKRKEMPPPLISDKRTVVDSYQALKIINEKLRKEHEAKCLAVQKEKERLARLEEKLVHNELKFEESKEGAENED